MCATVESWWVKLCNVHFSYGGDDPDGDFRDQQVDQSSPRTGPGIYYTAPAHDNAQTIKIDYLFVNPGISHGCGVPGAVVESSDHRPLWITVNLSATVTS